METKIETDLDHLAEDGVRLTADVPEPSLWNSLAGRRAFLKRTGMASVGVTMTLHGLKTEVLATPSGYKSVPSHRTLVYTNGVAGNKNGSGTNTSAEGGTRGEGRMLNDMLTNLKANCTTVSDTGVVNIDVLSTWILDKVEIEGPPPKHMELPATINGAPNPEFYGNPEDEGGTTSGAGHLVGTSGTITIRWTWIAPPPPEE